MNHIQAKNFTPNPFLPKRSDFFSSLLTVANQPIAWSIRGRV